MADINELNGVFGGVELGNIGVEGTNMNTNNGINGNNYGTTNANFSSFQSYGTNAGTSYGINNNNGVYTNYGVNNNNGNSTNYGINNNITTPTTTKANARAKNLPVKAGFWSKFKNFWLQDIPWNYEIKVELTPYQQKVEDEINEFLHQEITWEKVHDFLFQEVGSKR